MNDFSENNSQVLTPQEKEEFIRRKKQRNIALLFSLVLLCGVIYLLALIRL